MGFKTTSTRFTQAKSAQSSDLVAYNNATSGGPSISGTSLTANSVITTVTVTPGANASSTTTTASGGGVLISNIVYTNSAYATLSANAAATTYGSFRILGTGFVAGANVFLSNTSAGTISNITSNTTFVSSGEIRANANVTAGNYSLLVTNPNGGAAIYYSGVSFEPYPLWNTSSLTFGSTTISGNVATYVTSTAIEQPITFALASGNTLPTGLTLYSNGAILGTVTQSNSIQTYYANISATDLFNETTTANVSITIALADPSFNYTTLLLNGETNTTTYVTDKSTNNFALTVNGSVNPNRFSPLWGAGYYANSFDGSTGYMTVSASTLFNFGTGNFTIEAWIYTTSSGTQRVVSYATGSSLPYEFLLVNTGSSLYLNFFDGTNNNSTGSNYVPQNQWVHIAVSRSGTSMYLFINGVLSGTTTNSINLTSTGSLYIGTYKPSPTNYFTGYISNLRIVNGTAVYTSAFTPSTTPLTAIANTVLLTCQSPYFIDNSTNAFTITPSGTVKVVSNQPFGALPSGVQTYGSGLFDGSTGYITTPTAGNSAFVFGTGDFSMELWVYSASYTSSYISVLNVGPASGGYIVYIETSGNQARFLDYYNPSSSFVFAGGTLTNNTWNHLVLTRQSSTVRGFVNGQLVGYASSITTNYNVSASYTSIGATSGLAGNISNIRIVKGGIPTAYATSSTTNNEQIFTPPTSPFTGSESLTGGSVSLLTLQYKNGVNNNVFYDDSGNNFAITRTGTPSQGTFSPFSQTGWSNWFDGSSGYLPLTQSSFTTTGNFTIECWAYIPSAISNYCGLFSMRSSGSGSPGVSINILNTGYFDVGIYSSSNTQGVNYISYTQQAAPIGQWFHVALVRNGTTGNNCSFYLNGTLVASFGPNTSATSTNSGTVSIGTYYISATSGYYFPGYISNLRYVVGSAVYTSNFTPSTTPLTAIANTALLTCQSNRFVDNSTNAYTITPSGTVQVQAVSPFAPGVTYSSSTNGGSVYFPGSSYLTMGAPATVAAGLYSGNFTVEGWIYPTASGTFVMVSNNYNYSSAAGGWAFYGGSGTSGVLYFNHNGGNISSSASITVPVNAWSHLAYVRSGTSGYFFFNGAQVGTTVSDSTTYGNTGGTMYFGVPSDLASYFVGYMSNVRVTPNQALYTSSFTPPNTPFTSSANTAILLSGTNTGVQDATGKNNILTVGTAKTESSTVKVGSGAMYFDGSTGYLSILNPALTTNFGSSNWTIECYAYLNSFTATQTQLFALQQNSSNQYTGIGIYVLPSGKLAMSLTNTSASGWTVNDTSGQGSALSLSTWYHLAFVKNGTSITMYLNGVAQGTPYTFNQAVYYTTSTYNTIGSYNLTSYMMNGYMDEIRITNGVARYTTNFTAPTSADLTQ